MTVYLQPPITPSKALDRVASALVRHAPVPVASTSEDADLVVLPVVGRLDHVMRQARAIRANGQRYAVIQFVIRSSKNPNTADWIDLWRGASVVWSYYNLNALCAQDGTKAGFNFYHAPLGVDEIFTLKRKCYEDEDRPICLSFARHWLTESHRELVLAGASIGESVWHIGDHVRSHQWCYEMGAVDDGLLRNTYVQAHFVPGLRRIEGFELPAAEGLVCGAQPILFDAPHYRAWYDGLGCEFISENSRQGVLESLTVLFRRGPIQPRYAHLAHRREAAYRFDWSRIARGFWERAL